MLHKLAKGYMVYMTTVIIGEKVVVPAKDKAREIKGRYDIIKEKNGRVNDIYEAINNGEIKIKTNTFYPIVEA